MLVVGWLVFFRGFRWLLGVGRVTDRRVGSGRVGKEVEMEEGRTGYEREENRRIRVFG
jgi:hypothetical protein